MKATEPKRIPPIDKAADVVDGVVEVEPALQPRAVREPDLQRRCRLAVIDLRSGNVVRREIFFSVQCRAGIGAYL